MPALSPSRSPSKLYPQGCFLHTAPVSVPGAGWPHLLPTATEQAQLPGSPFVPLGLGLCDALRFSVCGQTPRPFPGRPLQPCWRSGNLPCWPGQWACPKTPQPHSSTFTPAHSQNPCACSRGSFLLGSPKLGAPQPCSSGRVATQLWSIHTMESCSERERDNPLSAPLCSLLVCPQPGASCWWEGHLPAAPRTLHSPSQPQGLGQVGPGGPFPPLLAEVGCEGQGTCAEPAVLIRDNYPLGTLLPSFTLGLSGQS